MTEDQSTPRVFLSLTALHENRSDMSDRWFVSSTFNFNHHMASVVYFLNGYLREIQTLWEVFNLKWQVIFTKPPGSWVPFSIYCLTLHLYKMDISVGRKKNKSHQWARVNLIRTTVRILYHFNLCPISEHPSSSISLSSKESEDTQLDECRDIQGMANNFRIDWNIMSHICFLNASIHVEMHLYICQISEIQMNPNLSGRVTVTELGGKCSPLSVNNIAVSQQSLSGQSAHPTVT